MEILFSHEDLFNSKFKRNILNSFWKLRTHTKFHVEKVFLSECNSSLCCWLLCVKSQQIFMQEVEEEGRSQATGAMFSYLRLHDD